MALIRFARAKRGYNAYPFDKMAVGDHFYVPARLAHRAGNAAYIFWQRTKRAKFTCKVFGANRYRISRVA